MIVSVSRRVTGSDQTLTDDPCFCLRTFTGSLQDNFDFRFGHRFA
jgi:hypothetical protein